MKWRLKTTENGDIYLWGDNQDNVLGIGDVNSCVPQLITNFPSRDAIDVQCGFRHTMVLTEDGKVFSWGYGGHGVLGLGSEQTHCSPQLITALLPFQVCQIRDGGLHCFALTGL